MTRRKALFVDLDGTLFDKHNGIPKSTIDALNHLLPDVDLYLATGRSSYTLAVIEEIIPLFKGLLLLNGQHVMVNHKTIFYNTMKKNICLNFTKPPLSTKLRSVTLPLTKHMFILIPKISINFFGTIQRPDCRLRKRRLRFYGSRFDGLAVCGHGCG